MLQVVKPASQTSDPGNHNYRRPLAILALLFFLWGFLTSLNDILIPRLRLVFNLGYAEAMLVQVAFFSAYFLFSLPWSRCVGVFGYKKSLVAGLLTMTLGAFLFIPAASIPSFPVFLVALLILGIGITGLQVAANPYVVLLGDSKSAPSRLTLTQAFNSLGTTLGPKVGGLLILGTAPLALTQLGPHTTAQLHALMIRDAASVRWPYAFIGGLLLILAIVIACFDLPPIPPAVTQTETPVDDSLWKYRNLVFGVVALFAYVGAEVSIGSLLVGYLGQPRVAGLTPLLASGYVSYYWGGAMIGRFAGAGLMKRNSPRMLLAACSICTSTLVLTSILTAGHVAMWTLLAVGFFNSIMFPTIFALSVAGLRSLTGKASGVLTMSIVGGAVVPLVAGFCADHAGISLALAIPIACYIYILFYAFYGSQQQVVSARMARGRLEGVI